MKVGDLVYVRGWEKRKHGTYGHTKALSGVIVKPFGGSSNNLGKAWHVLLENGAVRCKLAKDLELIK